MTTPQFTDARAIYDAALAAADAHDAVARSLKVDEGVLHAGTNRLPIASGGRIVIVGAGKAGARMAQAAEEILGARIAGGTIAVKDGHSVRTRRVEIIE